MCFTIPLSTRCGLAKTTSKYLLHLLPRKRESVVSKVFRNLSRLISEDKISGKGRLEPFLSPNPQGERTEIRPGKVKQLLLRNCSGLHSTSSMCSPKETRESTLITSHILLSVFFFFCCVGDSEDGHRETFFIFWTLTIKASVFINGEGE